MKKTTFSILISICLTFYAIANTYAQTQKELFDNGVLFFKQGQYQKAVDSFSKLIKLDPDNADAYKNRGVSYMKQKKFDLAITDFEKAKKLFPELRGLYSNLGVAWYYKKEYEKAIENYDLEIQMASENPVAYFNRALCLAELGKNEEALEDLSKTLELKPDFYWAVCYKADLLSEKGEDKEAIKAYKEAVRLNSKDTYAADKLAQLMQNRKKDITLPPQKPAKPKNIGSMYALQAGAFLNQANADKLKTKLLNNGFDSRVLLLKDSKQRTWYMVRSGRYENQEDARKALGSLKESLNIKPLIRPAGTW